MSATASRNWVQVLSSAFVRDTTSSHRAKRKRHDYQHRLAFLDDSRMRREMGHL